MESDIKIVEDYDLEAGQWVRCEGSNAYDHKQMMETDKHCARCGEADVVTFRKGDRVTLYLDKHGKIVRIDVGYVCYIVGY